MIRVKILDFMIIRVNRKVLCFRPILALHHKYAYYCLKMNKPATETKYSIFLSFWALDLMQVIVDQSAQSDFQLSNSK